MIWLMIGRDIPQRPPANQIPRQSVSTWRQCRGGTSSVGLSLQDYNLVCDGDDDDEDSDGSDARNLKQIILILLDYKGSLSET